MILSLRRIEKNIKFENISFQLAPTSISNPQSMLLNQDLNDEESEVILLI